jgi:hypothetical protein
LLEASRRLFASRIPALICLLSLAQAFYAWETKRDLFFPSFFFALSRAKKKDGKRQRCILPPGVEEAAA